MTEALSTSWIGPYRIERRLGAGGMGVVYLGHDEQAGVAAAVKLLKPEYLAEPQFRDRLRREVVAARRVPRFCTAQVLGADLAADPPWVATEYIDAPSLDVVLLEQGQLPEPELAAFAVGVAVALRAIHQQGVIHRDLKPANVLLSPVGPRVIDFGIARVEGCDPPLGALTPTGAVVGTPAYMAPEQVLGRPVTAAVDVFAWAGLVTYAATGQAPFSASGDEEVGEAILSGQPELGGLSEPLRGLVGAALQKEPGRRPSAAELVERLAARVPEVTTQVLATATAAPAGAAPGVGTDPAAPLRTGPARIGRNQGAARSGRWSRRSVLAAAAAAGVVVAAGVTLRRVPDPAEAYEIGAPMPGPGSAVDAVAVGELDGGPIAVSIGGFDSAARVWDLANGVQVDEFAIGAEGGFRSVAVGERDGSLVAVLGGVGSPSMQVWDLRRGEQVELPFTDELAEVYAARVSSVAVGELAGAPIVVSGGLDRTMRVWDLMTGSQVGEAYDVYTERDALTVDLSVAIGDSADAPIAVVGGSFQVPWARVWELSSGEPLGEQLVGHTGRVRSVAVGEVDGVPVVVSGGQDHTVRVWEPVTGRSVGPPLTGHSRYVRSVALGEVDGVPIAVSGGNDRTVRVWNLTSGEQVGPELTGHTGDVTSVAVGELDGEPIAVSAGGHNDGALRRWRLPPPDAS